MAQLGEDDMTVRSNSNTCRSEYGHGIYNEIIKSLTFQCFSEFLLYVCKKLCNSVHSCE